jgi:Family of unknown function (DUF6491)
MTPLVRVLTTSVLAGLCLALGLAGSSAVLAKDSKKARSGVSAMRAPDLALPLADENLSPTVDPGVSEPCINVDFIRDTKVRDDQTIRFRMRGGATYEIKLRDKCFGLAFHESFYYQVSPTRRLCARYDTIVARSGSRCRIESIVRLNKKPDEGKPKER